jgi:hypothetical protein
VVFIPWFNGLAVRYPIGMTESEIQFFLGRDLLLYLRQRRITALQEELYAKLSVYDTEKDWKHLPWFPHRESELPAN